MLFCCFCQRKGWHKKQSNREHFFSSSLHRRVSGCSCISDPLQRCNFAHALLVFTSESWQQQPPKMKVGLLCWLRGGNRSRERVREWQLAQANRTTANGTLHLLLPGLQPTSGPTKSLSCCCCWEPHQIMTPFKINKAPNVWHGSFVEHEIWATNKQMLKKKHPWFLFLQSNYLFSE